MKKLLLLLAALLLFAAPPEIAAQATMVMKFVPNSDGTNALKITGKIDENFTVDEAYTAEWPTALYNKNATPNYEGTDLTGLARIENDDLILEMDYTNSMAKAGTSIIENAYKYTSLCVVYAAYGQLRLFPGVNFKITPKDASKRITKVSFKTNTANLNPSSSANKFATNIRLGTETASKFTMTCTNKYSGESGTAKCNIVDVTANNSYGEVGSVELTIPKTLTHTLTTNKIFKTDTKNGSTTYYSTYITANNINNFKMSSKSSTASYAYAFQIAQIEVEYSTVEPPAYTNVITGEARTALHWNPETDSWEVPTQSSYSGDTEKFKLGNVITEFNRTTTAKAGKPTVTLDIPNNRIGAHVGVRFRSYPDAALNYKDAEAPVYEAHYYLPSTSSNKWSTLAGSNLGTQTITDGTKCNINKTSGATASDPEVFNLMNSAAGTNNTWVTVRSGTYNPTSGSTNIASQVGDGTLPAVLFNYVTLTVPSDNPAPIAEPKLTLSDAAVWSGAEYQFANPVKVTPSVTDANYSSPEYYYVLSDKLLDSFDQSAATKADGDITVAEEGYLHVYAKSTADGNESVSCPVVLKFSKVAGKPVSSYAELAGNDGELIQLDFVTRIIAAGEYSTGVPNPYGIAFLRDKEGNAIKIVSRRETKGSFDILLPVCIGSVKYGKTVRFLAPKSILGKLRMEDGHPVVYLVDMVSADDQFDYTKFNSTEIAPDGSLEVNPEDFEKTIETEEILPAHWGQFVVVGDMTGWDANTNSMIDKSGEGKAVEFAGSGMQINGFFHRSSPQSMTTVKATDRFAVRGIVDYDPENDKYILQLRTRVIKPVKPVVKITGGSARTELSEGVDAAFDVALLSGQIKMTFDESGQPATGLTYYALDPAKDDKQLSTGKTITLESAIGTYPTFTDGVARLKVYGVNEAVTEAGAVGGEATIIEIYDAVAFGLHTSSISDFSEVYADKTAADVTASTYVTLDRGEYDTPRYAVMGVYGKNMLMRDATAGTDAQYLIANANYTDGWMQTSTAVSSTQTKYNYKYHVLISPRQDYIPAYYRHVKAGDGIRSITGSPKMENGNWILDVTDAADIFDAAGKHQQGDVAIFADELESFWEPMAAEIADVTDAKLNRLVRLEGVSVSRDGNYTIADGLSLAWKYLSDADKIAMDKALIEGASSTATFNVTGLVMRDNDDLVIEVVSLESEYDRVLSVCGHQDHQDTWYGNSKFENDDNLVMVKGAQITTDGGEYSVLLQNNVALQWNLLSAQEAAHKALIDADIAAGESVTTSTYNVSGYLTTAADGKQTLDVVSIVKLEQVYGLTVLYNGRLSGGYLNGEEFYGFVRITADVPAGTRVFMRAAEPVEVEYDETDDYDAKQAKYKAARNKALDEAEEFVLTEETAPTYDKDMWIRLYSCTPGANPLNVATKTLVKQAKDVDDITGVLEVMNNDAVINKLIHYRGTAKVTNVGKDMFMLTDGSGQHIGVKVADSHLGTLADGTVADGTYLKDFVLQAGWANASITTPDRESVNALADEAEEETGEETEAPAETRADRRAPNSHAAYTLIGTPADWVVDAPEQEISSPEATVAETVDFDNHDTRYVKLHDVKLTGSNAEGYMMTTSTGDEVEVNNMFVADLASTTPDKLYTVSGYVMKARKKANTVQGAASEPLRPEFWVSAFAEKETTATPVFKLEGIESEADGKAITIADVTVTLTCASEGAVISYSTDGGNNWVEYKNAPFKVTESKKIMAKATAPYMMESAVATMEIVRETISGSAAIDFAPKAGYTEVTLRHEAIDFAGKYEVRYTTDGSEPTAASALYDPAKPLELEEACTVKAILKEEGKDRFGAAVSQAITVRSGDLKITATRAPGKTTVRIEVADTKHFNADGAVIYYSKNDGATFDEYQVAGGKNYVEFDTDKAITVVAYLEEQGKTIGKDVDEDITVDPVTTEPTDPEDPKDPTEPTDPTDPSDPDDDTDAIGGIAADGAAKVTVEGDSIVAPEGSMVFDLTGRRVRPEGLRAGIYIVRLADGTAVKVAVR